MTQPMDPIDRAFDAVWCAALDASSSPDFRDESGELDEEVYLRYQRNTFARARAMIERSRRSISRRTS